MGLDLKCVRIPCCGIVLAGLLLVPAAAAQSPPTCRQTLDSLDARIQRNYAGFVLEVRDRRRAEYQAMAARSRVAAERTALDDCYPVLAEHVGWFADPHLFVFQSQVVDSATAAQRAAGLRRIPLTEAGVRDQLTRRGGNLDPIEGIWYDGPLRVAIIPDPGAPAGRFAAVVLTTDTAAWPVGAVRAQFTRQADGGYATELLTRGFAEMELTARIHKRVLMRLSPGIWGKAFPVAAADTGLMDPVVPHRPRVSVREHSVVFSIPSHDPRFMRELDSLVQATLPVIRDRGLLIVDLRGNEGGGSQTTRALHPLIASTERRTTPYDSGHAMMLSSPAQITYARRFTGTDTTAFVRELVARLEAHSGELVPLVTDPAPASQPDSVTPGDWRVAVLIDGGTVSASEVTVLRALRSTRAVVIGEPTAGALDYQSVSIVGLGTGGRRWALGYPTITAHPDLPRRGMRGRGIAPELPLTWAGLPDPIAEVERRMGASPPMVRPGSSLLRTGRIRPGVDTLTLLLRRGEEIRLLSTLTRSVGHSNFEGEPVLRVIQEYVSGVDTSVDTSLVDAGTLAPIRYSALAGGEVHTVEFGTTRITGLVTPRDSAPRSIEVPLEHPVFNAVLDREIIESLTLADGFLGRFAVYNPPRTLGEVHIQVTGSERISTASGPIEAWVVEYRASTGAPSLVWVERESGRFLRRRVSLPDGREWWMVRASDLAAWREAPGSVN